MSNLISRTALLAEYDKHHVGAPGVARKLIEAAPAIDAVPADKIQFTDLYLDGSEAIAVFKFGNQGITLRKKCEDFAPVVRCKDCKFWFRNNGHDKNGCPITDSDIWMDDSGFCCYGERKDDDTIDCETDG